MFVIRSYSVENERLNVMMYKILDEEKKNMRTKIKDYSGMVRLIGSIIEKETKRKKVQCG